MSEYERVQTIQNLLHDLRGTEPLKRLLWTELNYDRANRPLSRKGWTEGAASALAEDPVLFATGGDQFHVIHARLNSDKLLMGMERPVVSRLLQDHPYAMFVFSNARQDRWHFLNVKYDDDVQRRRMFRRITIGPEERLRTASERIADQFLHAQPFRPGSNRAVCAADRAMPAISESRSGEEGRKVGVLWRRLPKPKLQLVS